jgi:hypothetical protein
MIKPNHFEKFSADRTQTLECRLLSGVMVPPP